MSDSVDVDTLDQSMRNLHIGPKSSSNLRRSSRATAQLRRGSFAARPRTQRSKQRSDMDEMVIALGEAFRPQFDAINAQFDAINAQFDSINAKIAALDTKMEENTAAVTEIRRAFYSHNCSEEIVSLFEKFYEKAVEEPPDFLLVPQKAFEMTSEKIFLPSDYKKLYELLQLGTETKPVLLIGNPGTGKSMFLLYVLYRCLKLKTRKVAYHNVHYEVFALFEPTDGGFRLSMLSSAKELAKNFDDTVIYLHDAGRYRDEIISRDTYRTVVVSSPNGSHYQSYFDQKLYKEQLFLPVWSESDIKSLFSQEEWESTKSQIYEIVGGIPRAVISFKTPEEAKAYIKSKIDSASLQDLRRMFMVRPDKMPLSHSFMHLKCPNVNDGDYSTHCYAYGSDFIGEMIRDRLEKVDLRARWRMYKDFDLFYENRLASAEFFESAAHTILSKGGNFVVKELLPKKSKKDKKPKESNLHLKPVETIKFKNYDDVKSDEFYAVPTQSNFPVVDAVAKYGSAASRPEIIGFQMTTAVHHSVKIEKLKERGVSMTKLIFVLPESVYSVWRLRQSDCTEFKEYALKLRYE